MAFVRAVILAYQRAGIDPGAALAQAQLTPRQLQHRDGRVTAVQFEALCDHAMRELDDEALGWFSRPLRWGSYGLLCRASLGSLDLQLALLRWCRHHRLLSDDIRQDLLVADGMATLRIEERKPLDPALREFCLVSCLRFVHGFACWAIDSRLSLREAAFPFAAPPHADAYPLMFRGEIRFNASHAAFSFDARYLDLPLKRDEAALRSMLQRPLPLTVLQYRRDRLLVQQVRGLLQQQPAATAEGLASALHVSVRTLHRQLQDEGASLQQLKDAVRREQAITQLRRSGRSIKQIARDVGFRNEKSFARAFKGWTGMSPSEYRQAPLL